MDKVILVIDKPSSCYDCPLRIVKFRHLCETIIIDSCNAINREIDKKHFYNMTKPNWCPLKKIPEKYEIDRNKCSDPFYEFEFEGGYNQCIDEILSE